MRSVPRDAALPRPVRRSAAPPGGGPAGRATVMPCLTFSTRPQFPQVGTWAARSTRHIGQIDRRSSPSSERTPAGG